MKNPLAAMCGALLLASFGSAQAVSSVTEYGPSCGLTVTGSLLPQGASRRITFEVTNAPPRVPILFLVSGATADVPLLPLGSECRLLVDDPWSQMHRTRADGTYTYSKALGQIYPIHTYVQFMTVGFDGDNMVIETSNGLLVSYE